MMSDFQVLIAEDEPRILANLAAKIEKSPLSFSVCGRAQDGREALSALENHHVDVLFTDIEMPKLGGLDLIARIRRDRPGLMVVIISGFDNFSYAQKAIALGVEDYLLKPVSRNDLHHLLSRLDGKLSFARRERNRNELFGWLRYGEGEPETGHDGYGLFLVNFGHHARAPGTIGAERQHRFHGLYNAAEVWCKERLGPWMLLPGDLENQIWLLPEITCSQEKSLRIYAEHVLRDFSTAAAPLAVTIAGAAERLEPACLYAQARILKERLRRHLVLDRSLLLWENETTGPRVVPRVSDDIEVLYHRGERTRLTGLLRELFLQQAPASRVQSAWTGAVREAISQVDEVDPPDLLAGLHRDLADQRPWNEAVGRLIDTLDSRMKKSRAVESPEALADSVEGYLDEHFREEITLDRLSAVFHYDAAYLARIYKRYKGVSPIRALTTRRILSAQHTILERADLGIKDIAVRVGYRDHHYFSRVFKKVTGLSPREFRSGHLIKNEFCPNRRNP